MFFLKKKMSKIMRLAGVLMLPAILLASCSDELDNPAPNPGESGPKPGYITISLRDKAPGTRATEADVDALNENLISSAFVCLYDANATETTPAKFAQNFDVNKNTTGTVEIRLRREMLNALFPSGTTCKAYVVANLPESATAGLNFPSIQDLQNIAIETNFASSNPQPSFVMDGGSDLTLTGDITVPSQCTVTGNVDLTRAASKIRLGVKLAASVTANGETWEPLTDQAMTVLINNGVNKAKVKPDTKPATKDSYYSTTTNATDETHRGRNLVDKGETVDYRYQLDQPFYTFPNTWAGDDEHMTYMILTVPFKKKDAETYRTCYYTVPVVRDNSIGRNISYMVNINVNILGSFNPDEPLLLEDLSYRAIEWSQEVIGVEISDYRYLVLDQTEYVVNNLSEINIPFYSSHETVVKSISFKYYLYNTSAAGLVKEVTVSPEVNNACSPTKMYDATVDNTINATTNARTLTFKHDLVEWDAYNGNTKLQLAGVRTGQNSQGEDIIEYPEDIEGNINSITRYVRTNPEVDAYSRFDIEITIVHKDLESDANTPFQRTIKITQYPAMYIEADANNFTLEYYRQSQPYGDPEFGNVYINKTQSGNGNMSPSGLTGGNRNPNMYIINVTRLSTERYRIGDPRVTTIDNLIDNSSSGGWNPQPIWPVSSWAEAPALFGTTPRRLTYYYPTDSSDAMKMTIAPKFRVASSYGVSSEMDEATAQRRCASYQEKGCPAGRWRLPTYAEMEYIINLSNQNMIPNLFTSTSNYWNASGCSLGKVTNGVLPEPNGDYGHVRCVYDEWYWESVTPKLKSDKQENYQILTGYSGSGWNREPIYKNVPYDYYEFTWGDKAR